MSAPAQGTPSPWWTTSDHERLARKQRALAKPVYAPPADDGNGPLPRPVPIIVGARTEDLGNHDWMVQMSVVEHGFPDVTTWRWVAGFAMAESDQPVLSHVLDQMRDALIRVVGRRHGIWVCTVTPDRFHGPGGPWVEPQRHRISEAVYSLAKAASEYQPLIEFDPWMEARAVYDPEDILRASLRQSDVAALGERALGQPARRV